VRILLDECCEAAIADALRADGHHVVSAAESYPATSDAILLAHAHADGRVLVTADKEFAQLALHSGKPSAGLVFLRMAYEDPAVKAESVRALISSGERLNGNMTIVSRGGLRVRPLR
jgi:predicted nuclease of predicted toxin-antitoxin system